MKLLHLCRAGRALSHHLFRGRQGPMERGHQRALAQDDAHRLGCVPREVMLKRAHCPRHLLRHRELRFGHRRSSLAT